MNLTPKLFKTYASRSINSPRLRKTYRFATQHALEKRLHVIQEVPEWEALRDRAHQIKEEVIDRLDFYLEKLETSVTANGGKVFWARDGKEASGYILEVARRIRAKGGPIGSALKYQILFTGMPVFPKVPELQSDEPITCRGLTRVPADWQKRQRLNPESLAP